MKRHTQPRHFQAWQHRSGKSLNNRRLCVCTLILQASQRGLLFQYCHGTKGLIALNWQGWNLSSSLSWYYYKWHWNKPTIVPKDLKSRLVIWHPEVHRPHSFQLFSSTKISTMRVSCEFAVLSFLPVFCHRISSRNVYVKVGSSVTFNCCFEAMAYIQSIQRR